ncbi:MAG TPA: hypothetical protein VEU33_09490, partial [Archangium sp.]|nr:hypothetical protein [Archangium sp.]
AGGAGPPDGGRGAAPEKAATPAPVANATPRKDGTRVKTSLQVSTPQRQQPRKKKDVLLDATAKTCVLVWAAGQLACASPEPQLRPTAPVPRVPPPAECPPGSVETMTQVLKFRGFGGRVNGRILIDGKRIDPQRITVRPGQVLTVEAWEDVRELPVNTVYVGQLLFGEGRVYGRFTQARTPEGLTYSVCFDLYDSATDGERGVWMEPGSKPDAAIIFSSVQLSPVTRFE